jgi:hypothetical protein
MYKKYQLQELRLLENKLKSVYNRNYYFKKLYESCNKNNNEEEKYLFITDENNKNIFSEVPKDIINFLKKKGHFDLEIFDLENNYISVKTYGDLIEIIGYLLNILEFDLINSYLSNENILIYNST